MNTLHIKSGDTVIVLSGKDKGKMVKVLYCNPANFSVFLFGINFASYPSYPRRPGATCCIFNLLLPLLSFTFFLLFPKCV